VNAAKVRLFLGVLFVSIGCGMAVLCVGCSEKKEDTWYQDSMEETALRDQYIKDQVAFGLTEEKAKGEYNSKLFWLRTENRGNKVTVEGEELEQKISQP